MEIDDKKEKLMREIAQKYDLRLVLLFGSQVDGKQLHNESDFDVAYKQEKAGFNGGGQNDAGHDAIFSQRQY